MRVPRGTAQGDARQPGRAHRPPARGAGAGRRGPHQRRDRRALVVSQRTAEHHVAAVLTKLGASTRREAAQRADELLSDPLAVTDSRRPRRGGRAPRPDAPGAPAPAGRSSSRSSPSSEIRGSTRSSQAGSVQARSPSRVITAGATTMRTTSTSIRIAAARPEADRLDDHVGVGDEAEEDAGHDHARREDDLADARHRPHHALRRAARRAGTPRGCATGGRRCSPSRARTGSRT